MKALTRKKTYKRVKVLLQWMIEDPASTDKRDLHMWKKTYTWEKRPTHVERESIVLLQYLIEDPASTNKRDLLMWKETYTCEKRPTYRRTLLMKALMRKETYKRVKVLLQWSSVAMNDRGSCTHDQKRPTHVKRDLHMWKETYTCKKGPNNGNEPCSCEKKHTSTKSVAMNDQGSYIQEQKRPTHVQKSPVHVKRNINIQTRNVPLQ